jgi:hypothetical protein
MRQCVSELYAGDGHRDIGRAARWMGLAATALLWCWGCAGGSDPAAATSGKQGVDRSDPKNVVEAIFKAAKTGDASHLQGLCDPKLTTDIDARRICDYAAGFDPEGEFPMFFASGRIVGNRRETDDWAEVPFVYGPNGDLLDTMVLAKRDGKWYLEAF